MDFREHIRAAVEHAGSQRALADKIGLSQQGVSFLLTGAKGVTAEIAVAIERATEGKVTKDMLRPDLFEPKADAA